MPWESLPGEQGCVVLSSRCVREASVTWVPCWALRGGAGTQSPDFPIRVLTGCSLHWPTGGPTHPNGPMSIARAQV